MTPSLKTLIERIASDHQRGRPLAVFSDYDGTLTPIVEHPRLARLNTATRRLLDRLAHRKGVYVAIVSGRSLDNLQTMVSSHRFYFAGTGGLELDLGGPRVVHPLAQQAVGSIARLVIELRKALAVFPGAWIEDKTLGCTVHYRAVPGPLVDALGACVRRVVASCDTALRTTDSRMAIEIMPDVGCNKAAAVGQILHYLRLVDPVVLYAGDAENDAPALAAVTAMGGISLGIGWQAPDAGFRLASPAALGEFLASLEKSLPRLRPARRPAADEHLGFYRAWETSFPTRFG